jgi:hypothetical protein
VDLKIRRPAAGAAAVELATYFDQSQIWLSVVPVCIVCIF